MNRTRRLIVLVPFGVVAGVCNSATFENNIVTIRSVRGTLCNVGRDRTFLVNIRRQIRCRITFPYQPSDADYNFETEVGPRLLSPNLVRLIIPISTRQRQKNFLPVVDGRFCPNSGRCPRRRQMSRTESNI